MHSVENASIEQVRSIADAQGSTLADIVRARAVQSGDQLALRFIDYSTDRRGVARTLDYRELDAAMSAVAASLEAVSEPGDRVAVLAPQGLDFLVGFLGALRAGRIAVPLFSPDLPGHGDRLTAVIADCEPAVVLATEANRAVACDFVGPATPVLCVDRIEPSVGLGYQPPAVSASDVAYLQYTSGSTRTPVGVRITHGNVVLNCVQAMIATDGGPQCSVVSWLPLFHDMGLVMVLTAFVVGGVPATVIDPIAFLMKPVRWLQLLAEGPETISAAPNFALDFCATRIPEAERNALDLSGVRAVLNGAEPIHPATMTRFYEVFGPNGLRPGVLIPSYGLAEATVYVSGQLARHDFISLQVDGDQLSAGRAIASSDGSRSVTLVACGTSAGQHVAVADPATGRRHPDDSVGEIWVNGPNVGDGYWGRPEMTEQVFGQILLDAGRMPETPWLRTGDLGFVHDGQLYVTGRIKDLLIIDGRNHYPQDLEHTVEGAHPVIARHRCAAFAVDGPTGEQAVVVAEISRHHVTSELDSADVTAAVRAAVSREHGVSVREVVLLRPDSIPRTTSGKIARAASRTAFLTGVLTPFSRPTP